MVNMGWKSIYRRSWFIWKLRSDFIILKMEYGFMNWILKEKTDNKKKGRRIY